MRTRALGPREPVPEVQLAVQPAGEQCERTQKPQWTGVRTTACVRAGGRHRGHSAPALSPEDRPSLIQLLPFLLFGARKGQAVCAGFLGPLMAGQTRRWGPGPDTQVRGQLGGQGTEGLCLLPLSPEWEAACQASGP